MECKVLTDLGGIFIDDQVIATIAGNTCLECYGIVATCSKRATDGIVEIFKGENLTRGVKVQLKESSAIVNLYIIVEYGISIAAVANSVIESVKYHIENQTGVTVEAVNVTVEGIRVEK